MNTEAMEYISQARQKYYELDLLGTYELILKAIKVGPEASSYCDMLKHLVQLIGFAFPEKFDYERLITLMDREIKKPSGAIFKYGLRGMIHKVAEKYDLAGNDFFTAAMLNRKQGDTIFHRRNLFQLAYTWKNREYLDIFTPLALSLDWNTKIFAKTRHVSLPIEIIEQRLVRVDFSVPPIKTIRNMKKKKLEYYFIAEEGDRPPAKVMANFVSAMSKHGMKFYFHHLYPKNYLTKMSIHQAELTGKHLPLKPAECPMSLYLKGYEIIICPKVKKLLAPVLSRVEDFWDITEEVHSFCCC